MKMRMTFALLAGAALMLSGCDSFNAGTYSISPDTDFALKRLAPANVMVGSISPAPDESTDCRMAGTLQLPNNVTPEDYVAHALSDELKMAGLENGAAPPVTLTGKLSAYSFSTMFFDAHWTLGLILTSSNGKSLSVKEKYKFASSYTAESACHNVSDAFEPAVQALIHSVVTDPGFPALIHNPGN